MSSTGKIIFGAVAAALTLGAMQFAFGHDLTGNLIGTGSDGVVNRAAKGDRGLMAVPQQKPATMQTISVRLAEFSDTSFLLRIPAATESNTGTLRNSDIKAVPPAPQILIKTERDEIKRQVACEPTVSVLTEIAKRLQPGRCVT